jgi:hypothetical protein
VRVRAGGAADDDEELAAACGPEKQRRRTVGSRARAGGDVRELIRGFARYHPLSPSGSGVWHLLLSDLVDAVYGRAMST